MRFRDAMRKVFVDFARLVQNRERCLNGHNCPPYPPQGPGISDHGALAGLADDDHTQYLLASGARALTGHWDVGGFRIENLGAPTASGHALRRGDESLIDHNALLNYVAAEHLSLPNTIANVLTDHNVATHNALGIDHGSLSGLADPDHPAYVRGESSGLREEHGGVDTSLAGRSYTTVTISFSTAFSAAPAVVDAGGEPAGGGGLGAQRYDDTVIAVMSAYGVSTTQFRARIANWTAETRTIRVWWISIGS